MALCNLSFMKNSRVQLFPNLARKKSYDYLFIIYMQNLPKKAQITREFRTQDLVRILFTAIECSSNVSLSYKF